MWGKFLSVGENAIKITFQSREKEDKREKRREIVKLKENKATKKKNKICDSWKYVQKIKKKGKTRKRKRIKERKVIYY